MSSFTIEELKKALTEHHIDFPSGHRYKKEDYVKLYEEHIVRAGLSAVGFSDDDSTQNSRKVSSTNEFNSQDVEAVSGLSNDDLFARLKELGCSPGPILPNTRGVYEKKFLKLLKGDSQNNDNGNAYGSTVGISHQMDPVELSDNEAETRSQARSRRSLERNLTPQPDRREASREPSVSSNRPSGNQPLSAPRRFTYIEKVPRGSFERIIVPSGSGDAEIRQRAADVDSYRGRWSPTATIRAAKIDAVKETAKSKDNNLALIFAGLLVIVILGLIAYVWSEWSATDPYKLIEDDAALEDAS